MFWMSPQAANTRKGREAELPGVVPCSGSIGSEVQLTELTQMKQIGNVSEVAPITTRKCGWVRLMFENSTVCHSRRISLLCLSFFDGFVFSAL